MQNMSMYLHPQSRMRYSVQRPTRQFKMLKLKLGILLVLVIPFLIPVVTVSAYVCWDQMCNYGGVTLLFGQNTRAGSGSAIIRT